MVSLSVEMAQMKWIVVGQHCVMDIGQKSRAFDNISMDFVSSKAMLMYVQSTEFVCFNEHL